VIVTDASAIAELLLARPEAGAVRAVLATHPEVHVPEHFHVEVLSVLRRYALRRELSARRAIAAIRYPVVELADGVWELRTALSAYDAAYLALARRLGVTLLTLDRGLAASARADGRLASLAR
jgi:predicted nucleic acid-binding protein